MDESSLRTLRIGASQSDDVRAEFDTMTPTLRFLVACKVVHKSSLSTAKHGAATAASLLLPGRASSALLRRALVTQLILHCGFYEAHLAGLIAAGFPPPVRPTLLVTYASSEDAGRHALSRKVQEQTLLYWHSDPIDLETVRVAFALAPEAALAVFARRALRHWRARMAKASAPPAEQKEATAPRRSARLQQTAAATVQAPSGQPMAQQLVPQTVLKPAPRRSARLNAAI
jgi:hypothetical protein